MMPPELADAIADAVRAGDAYADIAARFNVSTMAVARTAKARGIFVRLPPDEAPAGVPHAAMLAHLAPAPPVDEAPLPTDKAALMREAVRAMALDLRDPNPRTRAEAARVLLIAKNKGVLDEADATTPLDAAEREAKLVESLTAPDEVLARALARTGWRRDEGAAPEPPPEAA